MRLISELLSRPSKGRDDSGLEPRGLDEKTVFFLFNRVVEEQYGKRGRSIIHPSRYIEQILTVRVASPLWANELVIERARICRALNEALGGEVIRDIRVLHGLYPDEPGKRT